MRAATAIGSRAEAGAKEGLAEGLAAGAALLAGGAGRRPGAGRSTAATRGVVRKGVMTRSRGGGRRGRMPYSNLTPSTRQSTVREAGSFVSPRREGSLLASAPSGRGETGGFAPCPAVAPRPIIT